jgi:hypothetical protein
MIHVHLASSPIPILNQRADHCLDACQRMAQYAVAICLQDESGVPG